jgi:hypothetical protein
MKAARRWLRDHKFNGDVKVSEEEGMYCFYLRNKAQLERDGFTRYAKRKLASGIEIVVVRKV